MYIFNEPAENYRYWKSKLPVIQLDRLIHRSEDVLLIKFDIQYKDKFVPILRKITGVKWTITHGCWCVKYNSKIVGQIFTLFRELAWIDYIRIKEQNAKSVRTEYHKSQSNLFKKAILPPGTRNTLDQLKRYLIRQRYSSKSIDSYISALEQFFSFIGKIEFGFEDIEDFSHEIIKRDYSSSYQNIFITSIKNYIKVLNINGIEIKKLERPMKAKRLPEVLSIEETTRLISSYKNIKHKAIIATIYSAGLRISELLNLKIKDIDSTRNVIRVEGGKGNKDRYVTLAGNVLLLLREYYKQYRPRYYLFEGQKGNKYSSASVGKVIKMGLEACGIDKGITAHSLRHSYATHLHATGIDIRHLQELLGHKNMKTTAIYTHITNDSLRNIKSPLDFTDPVTLGILSTDPITKKSLPKHPKKDHNRNK
jgi:site-specific recombinase XerD